MDNSYNTNETDQDANICTLLNMGFEDETAIKHALRMSNNDINDAISILTNPQMLVPSFPEHEIDSSTAVVPYDAPLKNQDIHTTGFPIAALQDLESRVFSAQWSIPYRRDEALGLCLDYAQKLAAKGECDSDPNCKRFLDHVLPEAFAKLLTSSAVLNWNLDIQEGVNQLCHMVVDLATTMLKQDGLVLPHSLLSTLARMFDCYSEFHMKNKLRPSRLTFDVQYAVSNTPMTPHGWLVDLINRFGANEGFLLYKKKFENEKLSPTELCDLLLPFALCSDFLKEDVLSDMLVPGLHQLAHHLRALQEETDFHKLKWVENAFPQIVLIARKLSVQLSPIDLHNELVKQCLASILFLIQCPRFHLRIVGLKGVSRLIDECSSQEGKITADQLQEWLADNNVVSLALERNLDQMKYMERVKGIVAFASSWLTLEEITRIWDMQVDQDLDTAENIRSIVLAAAAHFNLDQFEHLLTIIDKSWTEGNMLLRRHLIPYMGSLGKDTPQGRTSSWVLMTLFKWILDPTASAALVDSAIRQLVDILITHPDSTRESFFMEFMGYINKGEHVLPCLKLLSSTLYAIVSSFRKHHKSALGDLIKDLNLISLITQSLARCHSINSDGTFTHKEYVEEHLSFLKFLLQEGAVYLPWSNAQMVWDTLVSSACSPLDIELCVAWFERCLLDLEADTAVRLFTTKILQLDPTQISEKGFQCFRTYFEAIDNNSGEKRSNIFSANKPTGMDFIWDVILFSSDEDIAQSAISYLLHISLASLASFPKKESVTCHHWFAEECEKKLSMVLNLDDNLIVNAVSSATATLTAIPISKVASLPPALRSQKCSSICRILHLAEEYIGNVEEDYSLPRSLLPHGASFPGYPVSLNITLLDSHDQLSVLAQSNENFSKVRARVASILNQPVEHLQIYYQDQLLSPFKDQRMLFQLKQDHITLGVRIINMVTSSIKKHESGGLTTPPPEGAAASHRINFLEQERNLPGIVFASGTLHIYEVLYKLATFKDNMVAQQVRSLLQLLPTDSTIIDSLDNLVTASTSLMAPGDGQGQCPRERSQALLKTLFDPEEPFKLLYNLEALCGKCMPMAQDQATLSGGRTFCAKFVAIGGLKTILSLLNSLPQICIGPELHLIILTIARHLLCGDFPATCQSDLNSLIVKRLGEEDLQNLLQCLIHIAREAAGHKNQSVKGISMGISHPSLPMRNAYLVTKSLEFMASCLILRSDTFGIFVAIPSVDKFLLDLLIDSPNATVRQCVRDEILRLAMTIPEARCFFCKTLVNTPLPFWLATSNTRRRSQKMIQNCREYFELLCRLFQGLSVAEQTEVKLDVSQRLSLESDFLENFTLSSLPALQELDNILLAAHFSYIRALLTCEAVDKEFHGNRIIPILLNKFLFPSSRMIHQQADSYFITPIKCSTLESRRAGYDLLVEITYGSPFNLELVVNWLISSHHQLGLPPFLNSHQFEFEPLIAGRAACGFVGLKNAGATCYMNAVLQQLFFTPGVKETILSASFDMCQDNSIFYQVQVVFGHLLASSLQYYVPEGFWKTYRMYGQPINLREHHDAFEFYSHLLDQLDEALSGARLPPIGKHRFGGMYLDQKVCKGCPHKYQREEAFTALNVIVKSTSLEDSLHQFVMREVLDGDNAYYCDACGEKRDAIKVTCIQQLPQTLVIQLKRFGYDFDSQRALKCDDYFKFPRVLDMWPYTAEGVQGGDYASSSKLYELRGIVVHSGQASAGHYYSFIKDRNCAERWLKFNDIQVEEVEMTDSFLEAECFGGTYQAKVYNDSRNGTELRQRYWSAYLLWYEALDKATKDFSLPFSPTFPSSSLSKSQSEGDFKGGDKSDCQRDSLSQLGQLVEKGEHLFCSIQEPMPKSIYRQVQAENLRFTFHQDLFSTEYFDFVHRLITRTLETSTEEGFLVPRITVSAIQLLCHFLLCTFLRYRHRQTHSWLSLFNHCLSQSREASTWVFDYLASDAGHPHIKSFLLECPSKDIQEVFRRVLEKSTHSYISFGGNLEEDCSFSSTIHSIVNLVGYSAQEHYRHSHNLFQFLVSYARSGTFAIEHLFALGTFEKLMFFLMGSMKPLDGPRKWNGLQIQDFSSLYTLLAHLIFACDFQNFWTCDPGEHTEPHESSLSTPECVRQVLFSNHSSAIRFISEAVVFPCCELGGALTFLPDVLEHICFCNLEFSRKVIAYLVDQFNGGPPNSLKVIGQLLIRAVCQNDPLHAERIHLAIDGDENLHPGMLGVIASQQTTDPQRAYLGIKFVVSLARRNMLAKDHLLACPERWQWAVTWLQGVVTVSVADAALPFPSTGVPLENTPTFFLRTVSAQDTLAEANALLTELETPESQPSESSNPPDVPAGSHIGGGDSLAPPVTGDPEWMADPPLDPIL